VSIAERYFAAMRAADLTEVLALFAPDAVLSVPDGRVFEGVNAIGGWFEHLFGAVSPCPTCVAELASERAIAVEIETALPGGAVRRTANFFDLNERGLIIGLRSYARA
jgi:ketosteroid isomerase-like protein